VFYGGEPLLNQADIRTFIELIRNRGVGDVDFGLYTNGILLDRIDLSILHSLKFIFISVDGIQRVHDKYRGHGTYAKILGNVRSLTSSFKGETIANVTLTPESSVFDAVMNVVDIFDNVHWNIVNDPYSLRFDGFLPRYESDIHRLVEHWVSGIKEGKVYNLIPFQFVVTSLITGVSHRNFPCGCGTTLRVVDTDASFFLCDELMDCADFRIPEGTNPDPERWSAFNLRERCRTCEVASVCGGGCLPVLLSYAQNRLSMYCKATKALVSELSHQLPSITEALNEGRIDWQQLSTYAVSEGLGERIP